MGFLFRVHCLGFTPKTGGISFSGKTLNVTGYPLNGFHHKPPLCKGRWHFHKKMTEGLLFTSLSSFRSLRSISQSLSLAFARQLPLHKGAFDTIKFCPCFLLTFSSSAEPLLNHATIAWFSSYNQTALSTSERAVFLFLSNGVMISQSYLRCISSRMPLPLSHRRKAQFRHYRSRHCLHRSRGCR